jgi:hypothetical protein
VVTLSPVLPRGAAPYQAAFTANASSVAHATSFTFSWNFSDGTPLYNVTLVVSAGANASLTTSHTFSTIGRFAVSVRVTDNLGEPAYTAHATVTTAAPVTATATVSRTVLDLGQSTSILLNLSGGFAPYTSTWTSSNVNATGCTRTGLYYNCTPKVGNATFQLNLTVKDSANDVTHLELNLTVNPTLLARATVVTWFQCVGTAGLLSANFTGAAAGGTVPFSYQWSFGDATPNGTAINVSHPYPIGSTFPVSFVVTDAAGQAAISSLNVSTSFAGCGSTPPPSYVAPTSLLEASAVGLVLVILLLAFLVMRTPPRPPRPLKPAPAVVPASSGVPRGAQGSDAVYDESTGSP